MHLLPLSLLPLLPLPLHLAFAPLLPPFQNARLLLHKRFTHLHTMSAADVIGEEQAWVSAMPEALRGPAQSLNKAVVEPVMNKCVRAPSAACRTARCPHDSQMVQSGTEGARASG